MRVIFVIVLSLLVTSVLAAEPERYRPIEVESGMLRPGVTARQSWQLTGLRNYQYRLQAQCLCALHGSSKVTVLGGNVVAVEDENGRARDVTPAQMQRLRIEALLALIGRYASSQPDSMSWRLNRYLGYPERIFIDPSLRLADDEIDYVISDLRQLRLR